MSSTTQTPTVTPTTDFVGQAINVGDTVAYAVRGGSRLWLDKIAVTQVHPNKIVGYKPGDTMQRRITIKNLHTCVVVKK
jgi:hypothetical protein